MGRLGLRHQGRGQTKHQGKNLAHGRNGSRVLRGFASGSGGRYAIRLDNAVASVEALYANPLFDMIDRHPQQDEAVTAAQITLEQEAAIVTQQPASFIHSSAYLCHAVSLSHP